ncbi:MAG: hypothetical protein IJK81_05995 [Selenomonadaceae bacterium]|nr:hypothetical protein [Selenomonadaceae bacterium]
MKMNMEALKALELKLAEYSKANGGIAEHESANAGCTGCMTTCSGGCESCSGGCKGGCNGRR